MCNKRHIKPCRYGPRCKRKNECQFKHYKKDNKNKVILQEKLKVETLKKEVTELQKKLAESKKSLEDTLHDEDILRADLKEEINSLKLENKKAKGRSPPTEKQGC